MDVIVLAIEIEFLLMATGCLIVFLLVRLFRFIRNYYKNKNIMAVYKDDLCFGKSNCNNRYFNV